MQETNKTYTLLLAVFIFAFVYRMILLLWDGFPPGADIGLHNSVIHSITGTGSTDFLYNYYHMGGGPSLTFPGYHIFTACIIIFTGLTEYVAHATVAALFSALLVLVAFFITKKVWSTSTAVIVAFLIAISRFDIEMLTWAGYPNVITLLVIPLIFYFYLEKDRFSKIPFFISTSILTGSIFLSHSLSAAIFVCITVIISLFILIWPKKIGTPRETVLYWILPIVFGALLVLPFLTDVIPAYLSEYKTEQAVSRILGYEIIIPLLALTAGFFVFSKKRYKKFWALPSFLLATWVFIPLILTQIWLIGLYVDYNRFLYFLVLAVMVFIGLLIDHSSSFLSQNIGGYLATKKPCISFKLPTKKLYSLVVVCILVFSAVALPIFSSAIQLNAGQSLQNYYQTMDTKGWEAIQWIKENTPKNAVFVSNALYGWWIGGYAQRQTLSAVIPEFLTVGREVDNASFARNLLDTNYLIRNDYIEVREDGGYLGRHNPEFLVKTKENYIYPFFNYNNENIIVTLIHRLPDGTNKTEVYSISSLSMADMHRENSTNAQKISVTHSNPLFNFTQTTTVSLGSKFAEMTSTISSDNPTIELISIQFDLYTKGYLQNSDDYSYVAFVDEKMKSIGQLVFPEQQSRPILVKNSSPVQLIFGLNKDPITKIHYFMGVYQFSDEQIDEIDNIVKEKIWTYKEKFEPFNFTVFDYRQDLISRNISYVILQIDDNSIPEKTQIEIDPKFRCDPLFSLVFINEEVAIYKVNHNHK